DIHTKVNDRKTYGMINGLSKKAIQTGIDAGSGAIKELEEFMNEFITRYASKKKENLICRKNIREQDEDEDEVSSSCSSNGKDFIAIENLIVYSKKGTPRKKRIKKSYEIESKSKFSTKQNSKFRKTKKPTQC
ncbi:11271_t:CDS:1, partial [Racocetra persica]